VRSLADIPGEGCDAPFQGVWKLQGRGRWHPEILTE
jgi:hypothetical protein